MSSAKISGVIRFKLLLNLRKKATSTPFFLRLKYLSLQGEILGGASTDEISSAKNSFAWGSVKITILFSFFLFAIASMFLRISLWPKCKPSKFPMVAMNESFGCFSLKSSMLD